MKLIIPDFDKKFILETDASEFGIGACLRQEGQPVAYISRMLNSAERNYSITEKEVLAAMWAMEKFRYYLEGRKFVLKTDHKAIEYIYSKLKFGSSRIARWFERLQCFQFEVEYTKGTDLIVADALIRAVMHADQLNKCSVQQYKAIIEFHKNMNHRHIIRKDLIKQNINITDAKIKDISATCRTCAKRDKMFYNSHAFVKTINVGEIVAFDILEIVGRKRVSLGIDYFTRKAFRFSIKSKSAENVMRKYSRSTRNFRLKE